MYMPKKLIGILGYFNQDKMKGALAQWNILSLIFQHIGSIKKYIKLKKYVELSILETKDIL